jgi:hypothetical protein
MSQINSYLTRTAFSHLSSYQRLAAKKALIGTTQVMYLQNYLKKNNQKSDNGQTENENKVISLTFPKSF